MIVCSRRQAQSPPGERACNNLALLKFGLELKFVGSFWRSIGQWRFLIVLRATSKCRALQDVMCILHKRHLRGLLHEVDSGAEKLFQWRHHSYTQVTLWLWGKVLELIAQTLLQIGCSPVCRPKDNGSLRQLIVDHWDWKVQASSGVLDASRVN